MKTYKESPYNDDFKPEKGFHQILFKPGMAVQARELTQLQTILRNQIQQFGNHIFKHGSVVIPGNSMVEMGVKTLKIASIDTAGVNLSAFENKVIVGSQTGVKAVVKKVVEQTTDDPMMFFVSYVSGGNEGSTDSSIEFVEGEQVFLSYNPQVKATLFDEYHSGVGSLASVNEGVYYINGSFVHVQKQTIVIDKFSDKPSCHILLRIEESIVSNLDDNSLLDPSRGFNNYAAPGADRVAVDLILEYKPFDTSFDENYIELMRISLGKIQEHLRNAKYSEIDKYFARRTYDESGNYVVNGLTTAVKEHKKTSSNSTGIYEDGDLSKMVYEIAAGKAYVKGYEIDKLAKTRLVVEKARGEKHTKTSDVSVPIEFGQSILISDFKNQPLSLGNRINFYKTSEVRLEAPDHYEPPKGLSETILAEDFAIAFMRELSGSENMNDRLVEIFGRILGRQVITNTNTCQVTEIKPAFNTLVKVFSFVATPADERRESPFDVTDQEMSEATRRARLANRVLCTGVSSTTIATSSSSINSRSYAIAQEYVIGFLHSLTGIDNFDQLIESDARVVNYIRSLAGEVITDADNCRVISVSGTFDLLAKSYAFHLSPTRPTEVEFDSPLLDSPLPELPETDENGVKYRPCSVFDYTPEEIEEAHKQARITYRLFCSGETPASITLPPEDYHYIDPIPGKDPDDPALMFPNGEIGSARVLAIDYYSGNPDNKPIYKIWISELQLREGHTIEDAASIVYKDHGRALVIFENRMTNVTSGNFVPGEIVSHISGRQATVKYWNANTSTLFLNKHNPGARIPKVGEAVVGSHSSAQGTVKNLFKIHSSQNGSYSNSTLLFRLPKKYIHSLRHDELNNYENLSYVMLKEIEIVTNENGYGTATANFEETFQPIEVGTFFAFDESGNHIPNEFFVIQDKTLALNLRQNSSRVVHVFALVNVTKTKPKKKELHESSKTLTRHNVQFDDIQLDHADVIKLISVIETKENGDRQDITPNYSIHSGQTDFAYKKGRLKRNAGASIPSGEVVVTYSYYKHSVSGDFFCVDSYPEGCLDNYNSHKYIGKGEYNLLRCIDFRRIETDSERKIVSPNTIFESDMQFYVPRIDAVASNHKGVISVITGTPSENPSPPQVSSEQYVLDTVYVPAYTPNANETKVSRQAVNNYTMKDIDRLSQRVDNVEEYITLTNEEQKVINQEVIDAKTGMSRHKTGYIVESFEHPFTLARATSGDFEVLFIGSSMSCKREEMKCELMTNHSSSSNYVYKGNQSNYIMLPYTEELFAAQMLSSRITNLNPFLVIAWNGLLDVDPPSVEWTETRDRPTIFEERTEEVIVQNYVPCPVEPTPVEPTPVEPTPVEPRRRRRSTPPEPNPPISWITVQHIRASGGVVVGYDHQHAANQRVGKTGYVFEDGEVTLTSEVDLSSHYSRIGNLSLSERLEYHAENNTYRGGPTFYLTEEQESLLSDDEKANYNIERLSASDERRLRSTNAHRGEDYLKT